MFVLWQIRSCRPSSPWVWLCVCNLIILKLSVMMSKPTFLYSLRFTPCLGKARESGECLLKWKILNPKLQRRTAHSDIHIKHNHFFCRHKSTESRRGRAEATTFNWVTGMNVLRPLSLGNAVNYNYDCGWENILNVERTKKVYFTHPVGFIFSIYKSIVLYKQNKVANFHRGCAGTIVPRG